MFLNTLLRVYFFLCGEINRRVNKGSPEVHKAII